MTNPGDAALLSVLILATSIWVGGYVAIAVVARVASATLDAATRVAFFRSLGRAYLRVGCPALVIALVDGGVLLRDRSWDGLLVATVIVAAVLVTTFGIAVVQARRMSQLRLLSTSGDRRLSEQVRRGARTAGSLRAALGALSVALVVMGAFLAT
ncbi:hypothetical protein [Amycolatopsis jejuensis]|uniref:hypothetical protein n=1 Tax=Amycolatopsis jejuensis TaxID=330084 RepID=UPI000524C1D2|nr:hypothetical protein [Amycolatopsis jejuensis]